MSEFPDDLPLRRFRGLLHSRRNEFDKASDILEKLLAKFEHDEETIGMLAGVRKRQYLKDPKNHAALVRAHKLYLKGWKASSRTNTYLGINAAATSLYLGDLMEVDRLALESETALEKQIGAAANHMRAAYWELATRAEALLLLRRWDAADDAYNEAYRIGTARPGDIESTEKQRSEIIAAFRRLGIERGDKPPAGSD